MPTTIIGPYRVRFYSSDIHEPPHVHVIRGDAVAKVWLADLGVAYNRGYREHEMNEILTLLESHRERLMEAWNDHFGNT